MYKLTDRRRKAVEGILEKYRTLLLTNGKYDVRSFEGELRACWKIGYQELKSIIEQLSRIERYRYVAAHYMEYPQVPGVVSEFQPVLVRLYGISHYHSEDREEKRAIFWEAMKRQEPGI